MSKTAKIIIWIIVIMLILAVGKAIFGGKMAEAPSNLGVSEEAPAKVGDVSSDSSDSAIEKDLSNLDKSMNSLNEDSANADAALKTQ